MSNSKTVLITGTSSGIGKSIAIKLINNGYKVYASARKLESIENLKQLGCHTISLDVTKENSMQEAVGKIYQNGDSIDILINNAGYEAPGAIEELNIESIKHEFETNVFGLVRLSQIVLPRMRQQKFGKIINIGSVGGSFTAPGAGAYHASKYAVEAFSDALRMEVKSFGIDVILIKPTGVQTKFATAAINTLPQSTPNSPYHKFNQNIAKTVTSMFEEKNRKTYGIITPEEVANIVFKTLTTKNPKARYVAGLSGHIYLFVRKILSDRMWDKMMTSQFPMK